MNIKVNRGGLDKTIRKAVDGALTPKALEEAEAQAKQSLARSVGYKVSEKISEQVARDLGAPLPDLGAPLEATAPAKKKRKLHKPKGKYPHGYRVVRE